jgi:glycosyltransferase involved in cell wall biosynthesis
MSKPAPAPLRILHVLRSPVGGLFRHVADLVRGQAARGHLVGMVCDSLTGGDRAIQVLDELSPHLALGLSRLPMARHIGLGDLSATRHVAAFARQAAADVVHGHGAKGGAYVRLSASAGGALRVYTPHGGSLLFQAGTASGLFYLTLERLLNRRTDLFVFESAFIERLFRQKIGKPAAAARIVPNGVGADEFAEVALSPDATDILYIGELRTLKGIDVLLDAMAGLRKRGLALTATIVGAGTSRDDLKRQAEQSGLAAAVRFIPPMPARQAFALGRIMVVPSRAESFPYIVLEAAAAAKPLVATNVGGIPDIFGPLSDRLMPPDDRDALERKLTEAINHPDSIREAAVLLRERVRTNFSLDDMVDGGIDAYRAAIAARKS